MSADCAYSNLVSPGRLISLDFQGKVVDDVDLNPLEKVAFEMNGGHKVSGWGDQVCDAAGNVFAVGEYTVPYTSPGDKELNQIQRYGAM